MSASAVQIGRYTGVPVAEGGFATVYRVSDSNLGIPAALKWAHATADAATVASLHHEFRLLGEFDCSQLPRALDFGWADDRPYLVTDWIGGPELWEHPQARSTEFFTETLRQIARVLVFVHHRGWVHGDLKPGNFRWGPARRQRGKPAPPHESSLVLYLLDFGLARHTGDTERPRGAGTVGYYAPEFLKRLPADGRADWYSVGAMLYEWLYGQRPFAAENPADEIAGHIEQAADAGDSFIRPAPSWARDVTLRLLSKEPEQRGEDIYDLMRWLGEFDSGLSPDTILNEQAGEHHLSESRRLDDHDVALLDQVSKSAPPRKQVRWVIRADQTSSARLSRGLVNAILELGLGVRIESANAGLLPGASIAKDLSTDRLRASSDGPDGAVGTLIVDFIPIPARESLGTGSPGGSPAFAATLLPWDIQRVADHLMGLTRDEAFSQRFAEPVWKATGGLPGVVGSLFSRAISLGQLRRLAGCWDFDESAIAQWQASPEASTSYDEYLGAMTADERRLCDWLAVGRSRFREDLLRELSALPHARFESAFDSLAARGVITFENPTAGTDSFETRFRLGGLSETWRAQLPEAQRQAYGTLLAERLERSAVPLDRRVREVLAECFADARLWDRCAEQSIEAAHLNVRIERHDDALRYIALAQSAAEQITAARARAHWLGRALMASGDCQKSFGQIDEARRTYREILVLGRRHGDLQLLAETLKDLGDLYKMTRQFEKGVRVLRRARQLWEIIGNRDEVARTFNNLGNMFWVASDRFQARRYYEEALDVARALQTDEVIALILSNLGVTYKGDHDFARAEAYYRESLEIKERLNSPVETARTLNNLGVIAFDQGHLAKASEYLKRASLLNSRVGAAAELLCNQGMLIHVALERGDLRTVIHESLSALEDAESLGDVATGAELCGLLAEAYLRAGDFRLSSAYLEEAREQASGQRNDDLNAHLGLVAAVRLWHLGQGKRAIATLNDIQPHLSHSEFPHLLLDALVLRMRAALSQHDAALVEQLWREGREFAIAVGAVHKLAQLAFARLPEDPSNGYLREACQLAQESLQHDERSHWAGAFRMWDARRLMAGGDLEGAAPVASDAVAQLREDGNWEMLWKALVVGGGIDFRRADYEPALTAFEEADRILNEIGKTIEDPQCRASYISHPLARQLFEVKSQILELTR